MKRTIDIAMRLKPFTHLPGTEVVVPGTEEVVVIFPTKIVFDQHEIIFSDLGALEQFTVLLDLEKRAVVVSGRIASGFVRYLLQRRDDQLMLIMDRLPSGGVTAVASGVQHHLMQKECLPLKTIRAASLSNRFERLSLGSHKKLDWELVMRRKDLKEILPVLYHFSQQLPHKEIQTVSLKELGRGKLHEHLLQFILGSFSGMIVPQITDPKCQGFTNHYPVKNRMDLARQAHVLIRSLFFAEQGDLIALLPSLPSGLHAGRFVGIQSSQGDQFDIEWSKHALKRVIVRSKRKGELRLSLPKEIKSFRIRSSLQEKGIEHLHDKPIDLGDNSVLYLDRFQK